MFNSSAKINYICKNFANKIDLIIRQDISILLIKITRARTCFEKVIENIEILIEKVIVYISIFVVF